MRVQRYVNVAAFINGCENINHQLIMNVLCRYINKIDDCYLKAYTN